MPKSDLLALNNATDWSGVAFDCEGQSVIIYNKNHSDARNESTIMHELSHIICEHRPSIDPNFQDLGLILHSYNQEHEDEANWLGGCLQLPMEGLVWALLKNMNNEQIASHFLASLDMVKFRLNVSGARQKFNFIRKKYRR